MTKNKENGKAVAFSKLHIKTVRRTELKDVTAEIIAVLTDSSCENGVCYLYVPHTTAGMIINEGYDPAVAHDIEAAFDRLVPPVRDSEHGEGNSDSHIKTAMVKTSEVVWIDGGKLALGRWQRIFFADFDGPRRRELHVKIVADPSA